MRAPMKLAGICFALAVSSPLGSLIERVVRDPSQVAARQNSSQVAPPRPKVDVGFSDFETNLTKEVAHGIENAKLRAVSDGGLWTQQMREALQANVSASLQHGVQDVLKPVKQSIGATWMALHEQDRKDAYIAQLRVGLAPVFNASVRSVADHLKLSLQRVENLPGLRQMNSSELVSKSASILTDSFLAQHCYGKDEDTKSGKTALLQGVPAKKRPLTHFCMQSLVAGFANRVNDTQGLISMTMRFEAGALALAQKEKLAERRPRHGEGQR